MDFKDLKHKWSILKVYFLYSFFCKSHFSGEKSRGTTYTVSSIKVNTTLWNFNNKILWYCMVLLNIHVYVLKRFLYFHLFSLFKMIFCFLKFVIFSFFKLVTMILPMFIYQLYYSFCILSEPKFMHFPGGSLQASLHYTPAIPYSCLFQTREYRLEFILICYS